MFVSSLSSSSSRLMTDACDDPAMGSVDVGLLLSLTIIFIYFSLSPGSDSYYFSSIFVLGVSSSS